MDSELLSRRLVRLQLNNCPKLLKFLQAKNLVCQFVKYSYKNFGPNQIRSLKHKLAKDSPYIMASMFNWRQTKQKHLFWSKLDNEYTEILRNGN